jgi:hypothetical protein
MRMHDYGFEEGEQEMCEEMEEGEGMEHEVELGSHSSEVRRESEVESVIEGESEQE